MAGAARPPAPAWLLISRAATVCIYTVSLSLIQQASMRCTGADGPGRHTGSLFWLAPLLPLLMRLLRLQTWADGLAPTLPGSEANDEGRWESGPYKAG